MRRGFFAMPLRLSPLHVKMCRCGNVFRARHGVRSRGRSDMRVFWVVVGLSGALAFGWSTELVAVEPPAETTVGTLRLRIHRAAEPWWASFRDLVATDRIPEAARLARQWEDRAGQDFLLVDDVAVSGFAAVETWLETVPQPIWQRWNDALLPDAERAWEQWRATQADDDLVAVCRLYGGSTVGRRAWSALARRAWETGRFEQAAAALEHVRHHRAATPADRTQAAVELIALRCRQGHWTAADAIRADLDLALVDVSVRWQGARLPTAKVLQELLAPRPNSSSSAPSSPQPALMPDWEYVQVKPPAMQPYWSMVTRDFRAEGALLTPAAEPTVAGPLLVTRTLTGIAALERASGRVVWNSPNRLRREPLSNASMWQNRQSPSALLEQWVRTETADSIQGRLTTDGERIFAVEMLSTPTTGAAASGIGESPVVAPGNRLVAHDVRNGDIVWTTSGRASGPSNPFTQMYFCGPPCVVDGVAYAVAQQQHELQLVAISASDGERLWSTVLGDVPRPLSADPARQRVACPVMWHDGRLWCGTANGAVVVYDPLRRAPWWAYRYRITPREPAARPRGENTNYLPDLWWDAWRDAKFVAAGEAMLWVSPESDRLHALDMRRGHLRWTADRDNALWLAGVTNEVAIVVEPYAVRAHHILTGQVAWRTVVSEVGGRPVIRGDSILQPLQNGDLAVLTAINGHCQIQSGLEGQPLGSLLATSDAWYAISDERIMQLPDLTSARHAAESQWRAEPENPERRRRAARLALAAGDVQGARERLHEATANTALFRRILLEQLSREPERWRDIAAALEQDASAEDRYLIAAAAVRAAQASEPMHDAARYVLGEQLRASTSDFIAMTSPRRFVRADLALLGLWLDLAQRKSSRLMNAALEKQLDEIWIREAERNDPSAIAKLLDRWQPLPFTRQKALSDPGAAFLEGKLRTSELRLLSMASSMPSASGQAWQGLSELLQQAGFPYEAAAYAERGWRNDPAGFRSAHRSESLLNGGSPAPRDPWPRIVPAAESQRERNDDVYQVPVPLDLDSTALADRLDISVDRQARLLRFISPAHRTPWEVALPPSPSSLRFYPHLLSGWLRGGILILRAGSELFAAAPFDDRGEPAARVLWTLDATGGQMVLADQLRPEILPAIPGIREEDGLLLDGFQRQIAQVGPVCASYLCYHDKGKLVCVDTLTGKKRWERFDLPVGVHTFGNEDRVIVWNPAAQRVDEWRALDGTDVAGAPWSGSVDRVLMTSGAAAVTVAPSAESVALRLEDPVAGAILWSQNFVAGALPFVLDRDTLGVVDPRGVLHLVNGSDGNPRGEPLTISVPQPLMRVVVSRDAHRWYVGLSGRVGQQAALQSAQMRNGHRAPYLDGQLYAIDRATGMIIWRTGLDRTPWPIEQPRTGPLLVQAYKLPPEDFMGSRVTDGVIRLIDKRSGRDVFTRQDLNLLPWVTLLPDADRGVIHVRMERETVRLCYEPRPPPPAPPD